MSRAAVVRVAAVVTFAALIRVLVRALRGEAAPAFSLSPPARGVLAPGPSAPSAAPAAAVAEPEVVEPAPAPEAVEPVPPASSEPPTPTPTPAEPVDGVPNPPGERWAFPVDGECPPGHPIKAKLRSGIYHLPGMMAYDRARPDRCYATEVDARADGLRRAKR